MGGWVGRVCLKIKIRYMLAPSVLGGEAKSRGWVVRGSCLFEDKKKDIY